MLTSLLSLAVLQAPNWTDEAVLRAERIVVGKVERVFEPEGPSSPAQPPRVALVTVSETLVGPPERRELLVIELEALPGMEHLEVGSEALLFLVSPRDLGGKLRAKLDGPLRAVPSCELLVRTEDLRRVEGCSWLLPPGVSRDLAERRLAPRSDSIRSSLNESIERVLPSLEARFVSSGPANWNLRLDARGNLDVCGKAQAPLGHDALVALLGAIDALEPATLPELIRTDWPPCASSYALELRTRSGFARVKAYHGELSSKATAEEREAHTRFKELWKLLPGEGKPTGLP